MCDDYETHVNRPLDPEVRRLILERRASREADLPEEIDGNRFTRRRSTDYKEFSNAQTLADLQERFDQTITEQNTYGYNE